MTLGEAHDAGRLDGSPTYFEELFGPSWRDLPLESAGAKLRQSMKQINEEVDALTVQQAGDDQTRATLDERMRVTGALIAKLESRGVTVVTDELVAETVRDLYGENPPPGAIDAVLNVVADMDRRCRGEPFDDEDL